jgi:hypothetical protein
MPYLFAVWRTSSRYADACSYLSTFSAAQDARWPSPQADLANMANLFCLIPPKRQARSSCAIMHGLSVYHLPEVITSGAPATECLHAVMRLCPFRRTVCERVGERWCDEAGCMLILGIRSHRGLHACWRGEVMARAGLVLMSICFFETRFWTTQSCIWMLEAPLVTQRAFGPKLDGERPNLEKRRNSSGHGSGRRITPCCT